MRVIKIVALLIATLLIGKQAFAISNTEILAFEEQVLDAKKHLKDLEYETIERLIDMLKAESGTAETIEQIEQLLIESLSVETRAIWLDSVNMNQLVTREKIIMLMDELQSMNVNLILADIFGNGHSVFPSKVATQREAFAYFTAEDMVPIMIEEAHKRGIEFHALASLFGVDSHGITPFIDRIEWFDRTKDGSYLTGIESFEAFMSPVLSEVREFFMEVIREILAYDIDGLHLDYIRYGRNVGYHPKALELYKEAGGDPDNLDSPAEWERFLQFRASFITSFVDEARIEMQKAKPNLLLSAAVASNLTYAKREVAQDWEDWAKKRLLHLIFHMGYAETSSQYQTAITNDTGPISDLAISFTGIGLYAVDEAELQTQLQVGQNNPISGQALFSTVHLLPQKVETLRNGVWRRPAMPTFRDPQKAAIFMIKNLAERFDSLGVEIGIDRKTNLEIVTQLLELEAAITACNVRPWDSRNLQEGSSEEYKEIEAVLTKFNALKRPISRLEPPTRQRGLNDLKKAERLIKVLLHYSKPLETEN